jgi:hypothetical protein
MTIGKRILRIVSIFFSIVGLLFAVWFVTGFLQDLSTGDETTGGYEYPYAGWSGTPIDYDAWYVTRTGLFEEGRVVHQDLNCTTGQLTFRLLGLVDIPFRELSDRAKVVHQPQVYCRALGFDTSAWDSISDPDGLFTDLTGAAS